MDDALANDATATIFFSALQLWSILLEECRMFCTLFALGMHACLTFGFLLIPLNDIAVQNVSTLGNWNLEKS